MGERPTTSIGLITTGTVLAVGVSAAYIAIAVGLQGNVHLKPDPLFMFLAAAGAIASLIAYAFTLERKVPHDRGIPAIIRNPVHHPHLRRRHGDTSLEAGPGRSRKPTSGHLRT